MPSLKIEWKIEQHDYVKQGRRAMYEKQPLFPLLRIEKYNNTIQPANLSCGKGIEIVSRWLNAHFFHIWSFSRQLTPFDPIWSHLIPFDPILSHLIKFVFWFFRTIDLPTKYDQNFFCVQRWLKQSKPNQPTDRNTISLFDFSLCLSLKLSFFDDLWLSLKLAQFHPRLASYFFFFDF